jgi:hypothetical protein
MTTLQTSVQDYLAMRRGLGFKLHGAGVGLLNFISSKFIADIAADLVGEAHVGRNRSLKIGSDGFTRKLEACSGAHIFIGNGDTAGSRRRTRDLF